jgi:hypothetical protein
MSSKAAIYTAIFFVFASMIALLGTSPKFLQSKTKPADATGKCADQCCAKCGLNLGVFFAIVAGCGVGGFGLAKLASHKNRASLHAYAKAPSVPDSGF